MAEPSAMLDRCLRWLGPRRPSAGRLRSLVAAMTASGLGPASVNRHLCVLRKHWPGLAVPWQREPKGRSRTITQAELGVLVAELGPYGSLVVWLAETGMRVGEAWALIEGDVGAAEALVRTSKNGDPRTVPLTSAALAAWAATGGAGWSRLSRSSFQHAFRGACVALGLTDLRPHDLRHHCASRLVNAGVPLPVVGAWLGHRDYRSTLRYTHVDQRGLQRAKELLEGAK